MKNITINDKKQTIQMNKTTAEAASQYGTEEYNALQEVRRAYPTYSVVVISRKSEKSEFKGLTYVFMEKYIKAHDDDDKSKMKAYFNLRGESEAAKAVGANAKSYGEIKEWFLDAFPEFGQFYRDRENLLNQIADKKAKAKQDEENEKRAQRLALVA